MINYEAEVEREARKFLIKQEELVVEAVTEDADFDRNDLEKLDTAFHEDIVDRAYTIQDAAFVIENCTNEADDFGGRSDFRDKITQIAAYSFGNDVWFECERIYKEIKEDVDDYVNRCRIADPCTGEQVALSGVFYAHEVRGRSKKDVSTAIKPAVGRQIVSCDEGKIIAVIDAEERFRGVVIEIEDGTRTPVIQEGYQQSHADYVPRNLIELAGVVLRKGEEFEPADVEDLVRTLRAQEALAELDEVLPVLEPGSCEEGQLLKRWLKMNADVGMRGGYPLGEAYIDMRCGVGYGMPDQFAYVRLDNEAGKQLPHLHGQPRPYIEAYYDRIFACKPAADPKDAVLEKVLHLIDEGAPGETFAELGDEVREALGRAPGPRP